ncbi:MAG: FG-GAP repeat protein [Phycisphaerales bacterium]
MNKAVRRGTGLSVIGLWLIGAVNASYAQDACLDARVTASDAGVFNSFGRAVGVLGDTAIIAAPWDNELGTEAGAVYVFRLDRQSSLWLETQKLLASDEQVGDNFGFSVAMDGELALIGAGHVHDEGGDVAYGAVYVFRFDPDSSGWIEEQEIVASDSAFQDGFGWSVSLSGDMALIGAIGVDDNGANSGSAYVFRFDPDTSRWVEEQKLLASNGAGGDFFGQSVAVQGDMAIIGANGQDDACRKNPNCNAGGAYVFRFDPKTSTWNETQKLLASDAAPNDSFGDSVALFDDILVIGAHSTDDNGNNSGSAYLFRFDPKRSAWIEEQKLLASDGAGNDQLGRSVAVDGQRIVVGAHHHDDVGANQGAAYIFRYDANASQWVEQHKLLPNPNPWTGFFGWSVALDGETIVIGAHGENQLTGAAYMFDLAPNCNCPQDLDADGSVGAFDLLSLLASWGPCKDCPADFDNNGNVGASDLLALLANWGPCP